MKVLLLSLTMSLVFTGCDFTSNRTLKDSWESGSSSVQSGGNGFSGEDNDDSESGDSEVGNTGGNDEGNDDSDDKVTCIDYKSGLKAGLYALKEKYISSTNESSIRGLLNLRKLISIDYFTADEINTPNRYYNEGVVGREGEYIVDPRNGGELLEQYIIKYQGEIVVNDKRDNGIYEFAMLSDDGVILKINKKMMVKSAKLHAVKFSKSDKKVRIRKNKPAKIDLYYYQGPRNHTANVLLWRKVSDSRYHQTCNNSKVTNKLDELIDQGWEVVGKENLRQATTECINQTLPYLDEK